MHIPDAFITPTVAALMFGISIIFLAVSWKKVRAEYPKSFAPLLAISSAFIFAAQMINFPIVFGTSEHLIGGTFLALLLGPWAGMLSMTIVLLMQAVFFADGGLIAFGANVFNMAVIGALSFFLVKFPTRNSSSQRRFFSSVFIASWFAVVFGSITAALQIGVSPAFSEAGGLIVTIPTMLFWHILIGLGEGAITTSLVVSLQKLQPNLMVSVSLLKVRLKR